MSRPCGQPLHNTLHDSYAVEGKRTQKKENIVREEKPVRKAGGALIEIQDGFPMRVLPKLQGPQTCKSWNLCIYNLFCRDKKYTLYRL